MSELKRTPLYEDHVALGGTMVDFGGWLMPIQYPSGIVSEHLGTRRGCGIFDVSHMGRLYVEGPDRVAFLQKVLSSNVQALVPGRAQYCMIPNENGGAVDDAYLYQYEPERYMLVVNASNTDKDLAHFAKYLPDYDCTVTNVTEVISSIAVQGPDSDGIIGRLCGVDPLCGPRKNDLNTLCLEGRPVRISRTGYTGEPIGYELFMDRQDASWLWKRLQQLGAMPIGLGARDTLRLEAGLPLYGHELGVDPEGREIPVFALSLARFAVSFAPHKGDYIGREALQAQQKGTPRKVRPIALADRGVIRGGMDVYQADRHVGWVTSGTMVPYWTFDQAGWIQEKTGKRSIGFAYLAENLEEGVPLSVDIRGKRVPIRLVKAHMLQNNPPYGRPIV